MKMTRFETKKSLGNTLHIDVGQFLPLIRWSCFAFFYFIWPYGALWLLPVQLSKKWVTGALMQSPTLTRIHWDSIICLPQTPRIIGIAYRSLRPAPPSMIPLTIANWAYSKGEVYTVNQECLYKHSKDHPDSVYHRKPMEAHQKTLRTQKPKTHKAAATIRNVLILWVAQDHKLKTTNQMPAR